MKKQKVRKPRDLFVKEELLTINKIIGIRIGAGEEIELNAKQARKLAAWLIRAANFIEQQGEK